MGTRDLTRNQFDKQLAKYGMKHSLCGYVNLGNNASAYRFNAGDNLRTQLAYLLKQQTRMNKMYPTKKGAVNA